MLPVAGTTPSKKKKQRRLKEEQKVGQLKGPHRLLFHTDIARATERTFSFCQSYYVYFSERKSRRGKNEKEFLPVNTKRDKKKIPH